MLRFSEEQLRAFSRQPFDEFKVSLADWLERHEPTAGPPLRRAMLEQMTQNSPRRLASPGRPRAVALSAEGQRVAWSTGDARIHRFDVTARRLLPTLEGHTGTPSASE